ncbi:MAG: hypothetical protein R3330_08300, partial [Saprospiraceae bacterium]|nr:hypothetical protein [Saprospiraceae bacterium]
ADTASDRVVEYQDNYYVAYSRDSLLEFHYDLWDERGPIWLSVLNRSDELILLRPDSSSVRLGATRYSFDHYQDWEDYVKPMLGDSLINILDPDRVLPLGPGQWKGLLGPELYFEIDNWKSLSEGKAFTRETSPLTVDVRLCYTRRDSVDVLKCAQHTLWVEHLQFLRGRDFQKIQQDPDINTADKFYLLRSPGAGPATMLSAVVPLLLFL